MRIYIYNYIYVSGDQCEGKRKEIIAMPYECDKHIKCNHTVETEYIYSVAYDNDCHTTGQLKCFNVYNYTCPFCEYCGITGQHNL